MTTPAPSNHAWLGQAIYDLYQVMFPPRRGTYFYFGWLFWLVFCYFAAKCTLYFFIFTALAGRAGYLATCCPLCGRAARARGQAPRETDSKQPAACAQDGARNQQRGTGVTGTERGLLIALIIVVVLVAGLIVLGANIQPPAHAG
jgi:hypothetical protein